MKNRRLQVLRLPVRRVGLMALTVALAVQLTGCLPDVRFTEGRRVDVAVVEQQLLIGRSSPEDVLAALGPPQGKGQVMLPIDPRPRAVWTYSVFEGFVLAEGRGDARALFLFVFFDQDRYDGYLWFSSVATATPARPVMRPDR